MLLYKLLGLVMTVVIVVGSRPTKTHAQNWKTFYNPEYKFSFDYPNIQTTITNQGKTSEFYKLFENPTITLNFSFSFNAFMGLKRIGSQYLRLSNTFQGKISSNRLTNLLKFYSKKSNTF